MKRYYIMLIENENEDEKIRVFSGDTIEECASKRDKYIHKRFGYGSNRDLCEYLVKGECFILDLEHRFIF